MKIKHAYCNYDEDTLASKWCDVCGMPLCSNCGHVDENVDYCNTCFAKRYKPYNQIRTKLIEKRYDLRSINKYTEITRTVLEKNHGIQNSINDPMWNLLIAVESLHRYMIKELNEKLRKENINLVGYERW